MCVRFAYGVVRPVECSAAKLVIVPFLDTRLQPSRTGTIYLHDRGAQWTLGRRSINIPTLVEHVVAVTLSLAVK
jgi:hypothetical protein